MDYRHKWDTSGTRVGYGWDTSGIRVGREGGESRNTDKTRRQEADGQADGGAGRYVHTDEAWMYRWGMKVRGEDVWRRTAPRW